MLNHHVYKATFSAGSQLIFDGSLRVAILIQNLNQHGTRYAAQLDRLVSCEQLAGLCTRLFQIPF